jgi:hypothetical protein
LEFDWDLSEILVAEGVVVVEVERLMVLKDLEA